MKERDLMRAMKVPNPQKKIVVGGFTRKMANKPMANAGCSSTGGKSNAINPKMNKAY